MTRFFANPLARFLRDDSGSMVVPFALWMPVFLVIILSSIELGTVTIRHTALERAVDENVRELRLGIAPTEADALKASICQSAAVLPNCEQNLQIEMVALDLRNWTAPPAQADCIDTTQEINPQRSFEYGAQQEVMLIRACFKYRPVTPAGTLSSSLAKDAEGYTALIATTAFVNEPS